MSRITEIISYQDWQDDKGMELTPRSNLFALLGALDELVDAIDRQTEVLRKDDKNVQ